MHKSEIEISNSSYTIIVPVYNGELTLEDLTKGIIDFFESFNNTFEIIFVYDCGPDRSWEVIQKLKITYPEIIKAIHLSRNFGQHNAILCGFKYAEGDFIITMDEDLQHNPDDIRLLISKQKEGDFDVVYGKFTSLKHSSFRNITSQLLRKILSIGVPDLHRDYSAFRIIKKNIAIGVAGMHNSYTFLDGYISWITTNIASVPVSHSPRKAGKSSYTIVKLIEQSINVFVTFSNLPIRILSYSSILIFILTAVYSLILIIRKLSGKIGVPGYASLMIIIGLGVGLILFGMGIIGEYIYRINQKTTKRPDYFEKT